MVQELLKVRVSMSNPLQHTHTYIQNHANYLVGDSNSDNLLASLRIFIAVFFFTK